MIKREPAEYIIRIKPTPEEYREHIKKEIELFLKQNKNIDPQGRLARAYRIAGENENTNDNLKGD